MADDIRWAEPRQPKLLGPRRPPLVYLQASASFLTFAVLMACALEALAGPLGLPDSSITIALVIHAIISILALMKLNLYPHRHFGLANVTTVFRAALTAATGGIVLTGFDVTGSTAVLWVIATIAVLSLALDGIDGVLARRNGTVSSYGARFDMEVDALLILLLALAVYLFGEAGAWVLLIGLMRYAFLLAQACLQKMQGDLPESLRRKIICVIQGTALCVALVPIVPGLVQQMLLVIALVSLVYSFAIDVLHLVRRTG